MKFKIDENLPAELLDDLRVAGHPRSLTYSDQVKPRGDNGFGDVYVLRFPINTAKGTATVLSVWIVRHGEDFPRLTICYIV
jgi:hypothetical protein